MELEQLKLFFLYCGLINLAVLFIWFMMLVFAKPLVFKVHSKLFSISESQFDSIHYSGMGLHKLITFSFFLVPYFVLCCLGSSWEGHLVRPQFPQNKLWNSKIWLLILTFLFKLWTVEIFSQFRPFTPFLPQLWRFLSKTSTSKCED